jgi:hypothetical protein
VSKIKAAGSRVPSRLFLLALSRTVADYRLTWPFYFPPNPESAQ